MIIIQGKLKLAQQKSNFIISSNLDRKPYLINNHLWIVTCLCTWWSPGIFRLRPVSNKQIEACLCTWWSPGIFYLCVLCPVFPLSLSVCSLSFLVLLCVCFVLCFPCPYLCVLCPFFPLSRVSKNKDPGILDPGHFS